MKIIDTSKDNPEGDPSDFRFVHNVIEELGLMPTKEKVTFPLPSRNSTFADIECTIGYNRDYKPFAEFRFFHEEQQLEMGYTAILTTTVESGGLKLQVQFKPSRKLRDAGRESILRTATTAKTMATLICQGFALGSTTRKVIPLVVKKEKVKKAA